MLRQSTTYKLSGAKLQIKKTRPKQSGDNPQVFNINITYARLYYTF